MKLTLIQNSCARAIDWNTVKRQSATELITLGSSGLAIGLALG
jgi:hypothetical protein